MKIRQDFIKEDVLVGIVKDTFPCTAEEFFTFLFSDDSKFIDEYRSARKDTNLNIGQWHVADGYDGQVREITFRSVCNSSCVLRTQQSQSGNMLYFVPIRLLWFLKPYNRHMTFHSGLTLRWMLVTTSDSSSPLEIKVGAHFKKWCIMQSKIKTDAVDEYKKEVELMLDVARSYISNSKGSKPTSTPSVLSVGPTDNNS